MDHMTVCCMVMVFMEFVINLDDILFKNIMFKPLSDIGLKQSLSIIQSLKLSNNSYGHLFYSSMTIHVCYWV
jgi:hypothetical protein